MIGYIASHIGPVSVREQSFFYTNRLFRSGEGLRAGLLTGA